MAERRTETAAPEAEDEATGTTTEGTAPDAATAGGTDDATPTPDETTVPEATEPTAEDLERELADEFAAAAVNLAQNNHQIALLTELYQRMRLGHFDGAAGADACYAALKNIQALDFEPAWPPKA